ncbi:MAG: hypothetical protein ACI93R_003829, partial [Flavobacteriales bacterium]
NLSVMPADLYDIKTLAKEPKKSCQAYRSTELFILL